MNVMSVRIHTPPSLGFWPLLENIHIGINDMLMLSKTPKEHKEHLKIVLQFLQQHKLSANMPKCVFEVPQVSYIGYIILALVFPLILLKSLLLLIGQCLQHPLNLGVSLDFVGITEVC